MSEYVFRDAEGFCCCMDAEMDELPGVTAREYFAAEPTDHYGTLQEPIVRCRDCMYYHGSGIASLTPFCEAMNEAGVEPDGFCKWGEPKEGGE